MSGGVCGCSPIKKGRDQGHIRRSLGLCQEGLGSGTPCLALAHPQEVIIHQKKPFEATRVVQDHSGRAKPPFNLSWKGEKRVWAWARHRA